MDYFRDCKRTSINPKVVVIGAGLAGLTAAYRLQKKGLDVHIYEARNRVGGRVFSAIVGGNIAEIGAQNIADGGKGENIRRLIQELCLDLTEEQVPFDRCYFDGKAFIPWQFLNTQKYETENLRSRLLEISQKSQNMRDVFDALFDKTDLLYKILSVRLAAYEGAPIEKLSSSYAETLYYMLLGGICSAHQNGDDEGCYVDFVSIEGGNSLLPEKLATTLGKRVHLNMPLQVVAKDEKGSYTLTFQNGQEEKADILVLAIPCSVYSDITFENGVIPSEKLQGIKNIRYGMNAKILIPFSQMPAAGKSLANDRAVGFLDMDRKLFTLYYTGESSLFSADTLLETYQREHPMLELAFGRACPPFAKPTLAIDESFASYEGPVGYSWPNDPFVKGSYFYISPGQESLLTATQNEGGEIVKTLFAPIDQTLYFAGEHASIFMEVPGTMEAACESGERAARMILEIV